MPSCWTMERWWLTSVFTFSFTMSKLLCEPWINSVGRRHILILTLWSLTLQARHQVPESMIEQIISLNRLDMELYKYAQNIFAGQHEQTVQKLVSAVIWVSSHPKYKLILNKKKPKNVIHFHYVKLAFFNGVYLI